MAVNTLEKKEEREGFLVPSTTSQLFIFYISNKYLFYLSLEIIQDDLPVVFGDFKEDLGFTDTKENKYKQRVH